MFSLTVCQPYADMIACGEKPIENRTWAPAHRGLLAIHAGKSTKWFDMDNPTHRLLRDPARLGVVVAVCRLVACFPRHRLYNPAFEYYFLNDNKHAEGPICWLMEVVCRLEDPVPATGCRGLWILPAYVNRRVRLQMKAVVEAR